MRKCEQCGKSIDHMSPLAKFCGDLCRYTSHRNKKPKRSVEVKTLTCAYPPCGNKFETTSKKRRFCSPSCNMREYRRRGKNSPKTSNSYLTMALTRKPIVINKKPDSYF